MRNTFLLVFLLGIYGNLSGGSELENNKSIVAQGAFSRWLTNTMHSSLVFPKTETASVESRELISDENETENEDEDPNDGLIAQITTNPVTLDVNVGEDFQLLCEGYINQWVVIWEKVHKNISKILFLGEYSQSITDERLSISSSHNGSNLVVKNARLNDSGRYRCRIMTSSSSPLQVIHTVNVKETREELKDTSCFSSNYYNTNCGGVVTVSNTSNSIIEYRTENHTPKRRIRCVWTIIPESGWMLKSIVLFVEYQHFASSDGGLVFYNDTLGSHDIIEADIARSLHFNTQLGFLDMTGFSSNSTKDSFRISIIGLGGQSRFKHEQAFNIDSSNCPANIKFPHKKPPPIGSTRVSIVLQPNFTTTAWSSANLNVIYSNVGKNYDQLEMYILRGYQKGHQQEIKQSGYFKMDVNVTTIQSPRLILLYYSGHRGGISGQLEIQQNCGIQRDSSSKLFRRRKL